MEKHMSGNHCFICSADVTVGQIDNRDAFYVECPICGHYQISGSLAMSGSLGSSPSYKLSAAIRRMSLADEPPYYIDSQTVKTLPDSVTHPDNPFDAIDRILNYIITKGGRDDKYVPIEPTKDYPLICALDPNEFSFYINKAMELEYLERINATYRLSLKGYERLDTIRPQPVMSDKAFVAMWFDPQLEEAWTNGIQRAIVEAGFKPIRIDLQHHNEKICDRIIAAIRESAFIVADFTGQRGGVYYEAGFAMGLSKPVIWTVKQTDIERLHFDTRQYNHIAWESVEDLYHKLLDRIRATIPGSKR